MLEGGECLLAFDFLRWAQSSNTSWHSLNQFAASLRCSRMCFSVHILSPSFTISTGNAEILEQIPLIVPHVGGCVETKSDWAACVSEAEEKGVTVVGLPRTPRRLMVMLLPSRSRCHHKDLACRKACKQQTECT